MLKLRSFLQILSFFFVFNLLAEPQDVQKLKERQQAGLSAIILELEVHYGMSEFKKLLFGISLEELHARYSTYIDKAQTIEEAKGVLPAVTREVLPMDEFRQLMIALASELEDGHTNFTRQGRKAWTLGIKAAAIDERLFVTGLNEALFNGMTVGKKPRAGDEIVELTFKDAQGKFQTLSPQQWLAHFIPYSQSGSYRNQVNRALGFLINRPYNRTRKVTEGDPVKIKFKRADQTYVGQLAWIATKEYSQAAYDYPHYFPQDKSAREDTDYVYGQYGTVRSFFKEGLLSLRLPAGSIVDIGVLINHDLDEAKEKILRRNAKAKSNDQLSDDTGNLNDPKKTKSQSRIEAYTVRYKNKNFGVIRIPDYSPPTLADAVNELRWITEVVKRFQNSVDTLIIDQVTNGGGWVFYVSELLRLFVNNGELEGMTGDIKLTKTLFAVNERVGPRRDVYGQSDNYARRRIADLWVQKLRDLYDDEGTDNWARGMPYFGSNSALTDGEEAVISELEGVSFDKPILFLNDSRSASGGDFTPSLFQQNKRAVIFGETSAGLGGPVYRNILSMPVSELFVRCTMAYCERSDGKPLENTGTVPDVLRIIQPSDLQNSFVDYASDALDVAVSLSIGIDTSELQLQVDRNLNKRNGDREISRYRLHQTLLSFEKKKKYSEKDLKKLAESYADLFKSIKKYRSQPWIVWRLSPLRLPTVLTRHDALLSSYYDRSAILNRLKQLQTLRHPHQDLLKVLIKGIEDLPALFFSPSWEDFRMENMDSCEFELQAGVV